MENAGGIWLVMLAVAILVLGAVLRFLWRMDSEALDGVDIGDLERDRLQALREARAAEDNESAAVGSRANASALSSGEDAPYRIDRRPMPVGEDPELLLPLQVGPFVRGPIDPVRNVLKEPVYARYRGGTGGISVELGICRDAGEAQQGLMTARQETDAEFGGEPQVFQIGTDPSFLKTSNRLGAFMAWTRGRYYLSAHARGGEADLERFMEAFPY